MSERLKTDVGTLDLSLEAALKDGKPYLGDLSVVQAILSNEASLTINAYCDKSSGKITPAEFRKLTNEACERIARIFLGKDDSYNIMPGWNEAGAIDEFLAEQLKLKDDDPFDRLCMTGLKYLDEVWCALRQADEGRDDDYQSNLNGSIETFVNLMVGIPIYNWDED